jgi:hypothetical protein
MPRKGAEVAKSVEPLIFTTFRFIAIFCGKKLRKSGLLMPRCANYFSRLQFSQSVLPVPWASQK